LGIGFRPAFADRRAPGAIQTLALRWPGARSALLALDFLPPRACRKSATGLSPKPPRGFHQKSLRSGWGHVAETLLRPRASVGLVDSLPALRHGCLPALAVP